MATSKKSKAKTAPKSPKKGRPAAKPTRKAAPAAKAKPKAKKPAAAHPAKGAKGPAKGRAAATGRAKPKAGSKSARPAKGAKAPKKAAKGKKGAQASADDRRRMGIRGAAPWAARHAAKHAAEARKRNAEPPLPGSARATLRVPTGAEDIKARIAALHNALGQIRSLKKNLLKNFFDVGLLLEQIKSENLFEAKGFGSFEAFLEREIDLGKTTALRLVKVVQTFQRSAAEAHGLDRLFHALVALEFGPESVAEASGKIPPAPLSSPQLPLKPPGR